MKYNVYIASCVNGGGIYHYVLDNNGLLTFNKKYTMHKPMYLLDTNNRLHFIIRSFYDNDFSAYGSYEYASDGSLINTSPLQSTKGICGCHLFVNDNVYITNYRTGNICKLPDKMDIHEGYGFDPSRQERSHPHSVIGTRDGKYILSADLGLDTVYVYDQDLNLICTSKVPIASGARHLVLNYQENFLYCVNELISSVTVFSFKNGLLNNLHTYPGYDKTKVDETIENTAAAIRLSKNGKILFISNRGFNDITMFEVEGNDLKLLNSVSTTGNWPRDFMLSPNEKFLIVTNEFSNNVSVFKYDGKMNLTKVSEVEVPSPLSVVIR